MHKVIINMIMTLVLSVSVLYCIIEAKNNEIQQPLNQSVINSEQKVIELGQFNENNVVIDNLDQKIIELENQYNKTTEVQNKERENVTTPVYLVNKYIDTEEFMVKEEAKSVVNKDLDISQYSYVQYINGKRTDITDDQIRYAVKKMSDSGLNPHLLFCIFYNESRGQIKVVNNSSNCIGYGQILPSTGKFIYEQYLNNGKGSYNHNLAYDPYVNIDISIGLLEYLMDTNNGNLHATLRGYSGRSNDSYYTLISSLLPDGVKMSDIQKEYKVYNNIS